MPSIQHRAVPLALFAVLTAGCLSHERGLELQQFDAGQEGGTEPISDAAVDATHDSAGPFAPQDGGPRDSSISPEAGPMDAGHDAALDAALDAGHDAASVAVSDAAPDSSLDGSTDGEIDAVADASPPDAAADTGGDSSWDGNPLSCVPGPTVVLNGDFSLGNVDFSSDYAYVTQISSETQYAIAESPSTVSIWGAGWAAMNPPDGGTGNMLIANGATTADASVWTETVTVEPNTTYQISFWAACVDGAPVATLQPLVNGASVGDLFTVNSTPGTWSQFVATWSSGSSSSAQIRLVDTDLNAGNNDYVVDDIVLAPCE